MNVSLDMPIAPDATIGVCSSGMLRLPCLPALLGKRRNELKLTDKPRKARHCDVFIGWGNKRSGQLAKELSARYGGSFLLLEDTFLRSVAPQGRFGEPPLGMVVDDEGIYYDAAAPSRLERLVTQAVAGNGVERQAGADMLTALRRCKVSKYNDYAPMPESLARELSQGRAVLVVDQTWQDLSIAGAGCDEDCFRRMLEAAHDENPGSLIVVKLHPEVLSGAKKGYLRDLAARYNCRILAQNHNPWDLLPRCSRVYVVSSQMGFDSLLAGTPVRCFGMPFYAGWGLTDDDLPAPDRRRKVHGVTLEHLAWAALDGYAVYINPFTHERMSAVQAMELLAEWRDRHMESLRISTFYGISGWKRTRVRKMFYKHGQRGIFHRSPRRALRHAKRHGGVLVAWASRAEVPSLERQAAREGVEVWRLEDGFIRSVGLGAELVPPMSLVLDRCGIYYDPLRESQLEQILQHQDIPAELVRRAQHLRHRLVSENITKYNLAEQQADVDAPADRKVILVPGQVDDDASIRLGAEGMRGEEHLRRVREQNPDAFIIFKPHPDVVAGQRPGLDAGRAAHQLADLVASDQSITALIDVADEVHVLTSLAGFEALLRGRKVFCHGLPFYAGWGLTHDYMHCSRRSRVRSLDELVAAVLILYSRYHDPLSDLPCGPEVVMQRIGEQRKSPPRPSLLTRLRVLQGRTRKRLTAWLRPLA